MVTITGSGAITDAAAASWVIGMICRRVSHLPMLCVVHLLTLLSFDSQHQESKMRLRLLQKVQRKHPASESADY